VLDDIGFDSPGWEELAGALALGLAAWLAWIALQLARAPSRAAPDALAQAYARLCRKLERVGFARAPYEGPLAFAARVLREDQELASSAVPLLNRYAELRFESPSSLPPNDVAAFRRAVAQLHVRRRRGFVPLRAAG
jgi:protein-glutamine gamma-glutamyltransferase